VLPILGAGLLTTQLLERSVREDAAVRERALAALAASLVRDFIARGNEKITTVGRLLAKELHPSNDEEYQKTVVGRLSNLVEPPDAYLSLKFFPKGSDLVVQSDTAEYQNAQMLMNGNDAGQNARSQMARNRQDARNPIVLQPLEAGKPFVGELEESAGFETLPISVPMSRGEKPLGAVVAYLDFRRVNALLANVAQSGCGVKLLDGSGKTLAEAGESPEPSLLQALPAGHGDWRVEVREPAARLYKSTEAVRKQVELWVALAALLAILLSFLIAGRIVGPIARLSDAARAMESGDLAARARIERSDEIGRLAQNFDRMAASLERLDDAKSEFVASVSHELRTPLTAIRLSIANLLDGVLGPVDEAQKTTLTRLRGDVDRMIRMVNDLLEMARLEAGAVAPRREQVELATLAREVAAALEPLARQKNVEVRVAGEGMASVDRSMIHRVISNLVDNGIKFTPEGGSVTIAVSENSVSVTDTGPGVRNERLFEKFAQVAVDGVKPHGTGLGLAIVKKLVELHGGAVKHEPSDGGARFVVTL
jgi:signal transduction histidine kinase